MSKKEGENTDKEKEPVKAQPHLEKMKKALAKSFESHGHPVEAIHISGECIEPLARIFRKK